MDFRNDSLEMRVNDTEQYFLLKHGNLTIIIKT